MPPTDTLVAPFAEISANHAWMPVGFDNLTEAQLHNAPRLLEGRNSDALHNWWLVRKGNAKTPHIDIASTCTIEGRPGLLLVEAKAHDEELIQECAGKRLDEHASAGSAANHERIGIAIAEACTGLAAATKLVWQISRDSHYQMSNRFAWSWKLTELGVPVILVYLGFLNADEMVDRGKPFQGHRDWEALVKAQSTQLFPASVWGQPWRANGQAFVPLIKSFELALDHEVV